MRSESANTGDHDYDSEWHKNESDNECEGDDEVTLSKRSRTILWLCQEGQIELARKRFDLLVERGKQSDDTSTIYSSQLQREVFQIGRDRNYPLHEILMGGTSDRNAYALTVSILAYAKNYPLQQQRMLSMRPPSHGRTALHWAAWGNAKFEIFQALVLGNPEAVLLQDKRVQGERTPIEILQRYFVTQDHDHPPNRSVTQNDQIIDLLKRMRKSWIAHRIRLAFHICANRYFASTSDTSTLTPFDKRDRLVANVKPKPWYLLSIVGYFLQREMKPLAVRIMSYLGGNAVAVKKRRKTRVTKPITTGKRKR